jgi:hypothetical protein
VGEGSSRSGKWNELFLSAQACEGYGDNLHIREIESNVSWIGVF